MIMPNYIKTGESRLVICVGKYAIKIAKLSTQKQCFKKFIHGCRANKHEHHYYMNRCTLFKHVAPSIFCSMFGLIQIQTRCKQNYINLTNSQKELFATLCGNDNKPTNFGWLNGNLVCLDYMAA